MSAAAGDNNSCVFCEVWCEEMVEECVSDVSNSEAGFDAIFCHVQPGGELQGSV